MSNTVIVGAQWGDEGKGKIVDYLTADAEFVVRSQGGSNAGHTVITGGNTYILHLIPSGILWENKICVIGNGVVVDPLALLEEIDTLAQQGIEVSPEKLRLSERAHLTMPYHRALDRCNEAQRGDKKIGTTGRGIGPTYADKIERHGLRAAALKDPILLADTLNERCEKTNELLKLANLETIDIEAAGKEILDAAERLAPYLADTAVLLHEAVAAKKQLLFEGAQGTFLDIDHGTYPYVTSSNTTSGGVCTGTGVPPRAIEQVVGVSKAYTTRVGEGPFVTENQEFSDKMHAMGMEFGATTGRPRRCGWFDAVLVGYAGIVNGIDSLALTVLDGLDDMETLRICHSYELDGATLKYPPASSEELERCIPLYEELPGWQSDTTAIRDAAELPENAKAYLTRITELTGLPIKYLGVGPDREQTLLL